MARETETVPTQLCLGKVAVPALQFLPGVQRWNQGRVSRARSRLWGLRARLWPGSGLPKPSTNRLSLWRHRRKAFAPARPCSAIIPLAWIACHFHAVSEEVLYIWGDPVS